MNCYIVTIAFKASISNANGYAEIKLKEVMVLLMRELQIH